LLRVGVVRLSRLLCRMAPPPSPTLPHKGGGSTPSLLLALASRRECLALPLLMAASGIANSQPARRDAEGSKRRADDGVRHLHAESTSSGLRGLRAPASAVG
jgi:hypothetical protein